MNRNKNIFSYILDQWFAVRQFPPGFARPSVVRGYFEEHEDAQLQQLFFEELRKQGFKRTPWQFIMPEQTAGLIKKVEPTPEGANQYHIRFYSDGTIDCELETHNFSIHHFSGYRVEDPNLLHQFLEPCDMPDHLRHQVKKLFGVKEYTKSPIRVKTK